MASAKVPMKLLLFGNPALPLDNLAVKIGKMLEQEGCEILHLEDPLGLLDLDLSQYVILDVAEGIAEPKLITDADKLILGRLCSLHDFDMAYFLKLLTELGKLHSLRIVALPQEGCSDLLGKVRTLLSSMSCFP